MTRALLAVVCAFAALSSSAAAELGLQEVRVVVFAGLVAALCALPFLRGAPPPRPGAGLVCLFLLLLVIGVQDALDGGGGGGLDPIDYKVALPLLVLLAAPALAAEFEGEAFARFVWRLLALYVAGTFAYQVAAEPAAVARGYAGIVRYDPTGSVVMHASLSAVCLLLALARLGGPAAGWRERGAALAAAAVSALMVLQTATRTFIVTLGLFALFRVATARDRRAALGTLAAAACGLGLVFVAYAQLWDPSFLLRLTSTEGVEDYGSGRLPSLAHWLGLAGEHPMGLGFGAVRELMADGKPSLGGESTLEWPHNEFVRFYVEAGPPGLAFVVLLVGLLVRSALLAAAREGDPVRRTLALAVAADIVAEASLQNLLNAVYHATVLVAFLALAVQRPGPARSVPQVGPGQATALAPS
jgi:hypothetical protein